MFTSVRQKTDGSKNTEEFAERKAKSVGSGYTPLFWLAKLDDSIVFSRGFFRATTALAFTGALLQQNGCL